jgi:hypothetical protein
MTARRDLDTDLSPRREPDGFCAAVVAAGQERSVGDVVHRVRKARR